MSEDRLTSFLQRLSCAESHEEEEELGRSELSSIVFSASSDVLTRILTIAKRDDRMRRCLSAARYYSGLSIDKCDRIDAVLLFPFPAAKKTSRLRKK